MRKHKLTFSPVPASSMQKARICPIESVFWPPSAARGCRCPPTGAKGDRTPYGFLSPLDSPYLPFKPRLPAVARLKNTKESTDLNLYSPFSYAITVYLREPPRITVRGHSVQGVRLVLRTAPLPSMVCPWSTERPCGPLAFRRATEGSRVLRKMRGSQEGDKKPFGVLSPSCSRR